MDKVTAWADLHESPSDEALMDAYVRGDTAAFERLYERWSDRLFGYLARALDASARGSRRVLSGVCERLDRPAVQLRLSRE